MPQIELRLKSGVRSQGDLLLTVQDNTHDYLLSTSAPEIRVSAYLDRDWPQVEASYAEIFVNEACTSEFKVRKIAPGSKTRKNIQLPGAMKQGEQLVITVERIDQVSSSV